MQKNSVNICFALYIFSVFVHIQSLEPDSCCSHAKLLCSRGPVPLTPVMTFLALLHLPWSSFPTSTMNRKKHLLHIALLNGTDRMILDLLNGYCLWQAEGEKNLHLLYCPLHSYSMVFAIADSISHRELWRTAEGSSVLKNFDHKKRLQLRTDWLSVRVWGRGNLLRLRPFIGPWLT